MNGAFLATRLVPVAFVLLWSTGFIGARFGLPYAEPFTFLAVRMVATLALLLPLAALMRAPWPRSWREAGHIAVAGVLLHAVYLGGVFAAIERGMPAGLAALIVGLQPLLTAAAARAMVGERVSPRQWLGLALGFGGVALVLGGRITGFGVDAVALAWVVAALAAISLGTLYQKRFCSGMDLRTGTTVQYVATLAVLAPLAWATESMEIVWSGEFVFALAWLTVMLSVVAIMLLTFMIRHGAASRVASLFYLVPPVTALEAWLLFGERLGPVAIAGMALAAVGVALAVRPARARPAAAAEPAVASPDPETAR